MHDVIYKVLVKLSSILIHLALRIGSKQKVEFLGSGSNFLVVTPITLTRIQLILKLLVRYDKKERYSITFEEQV